MAELKDIAALQLDELFDVEALLHTAIQAAPIDEALSQEQAARLHRLLWVTHAKVQGVLGALKPHA